ncbi:MAG: hypothetical protein HYV40_02745, partial [Candidatus Levybacteria bacterium]|nr:hypothetical protein [Candidatus Levybacteria bacterium]
MCNTYAGTVSGPCSTSSGAPPGVCAYGLAGQHDMRCGAGEGSICGVVSCYPVYPPGEGWNTTGCYWDYGGGSDGGYGDGGYGDGGYGDGAYVPPPTNTPTPTRTPTPTPRPDLAVVTFKLTDIAGNTRPSDSPYGTPRFFTGEEICPFVTIKNQSNTPSTSATGYTWTAFYSDGSGSTPPAINTASDVDIYLKNGLFGAQFQKTYGASPIGPNSSYYTYKTGSNNQKKCWTATSFPSRKHSWVHVNYDRGASDSVFSNNTREYEYWVEDAPEYDVSGRVFDDENADSIYNNSAENYSGTYTVTATRSDNGYTATLTNQSGTYSFNNLPIIPNAASSYTITVSSIAAPYAVTFPAGGSYSVALGDNCSITPTGGQGTCSSGNVTNLNIAVRDLSIPPSGNYNISGRIFIDTNQNGVYDSATEDPVPDNFGYQMSVVKTGVPPYPVTENDNGTGQFIARDLPTGTYAVSYTNLPPSYQSTLPGGSPPIFTVTIGNPCNITPPIPNKTCSVNQSMTGINFGIVLKSTPTPTSPPPPIVGPLSVSGRVYVDSNPQNGQFDTGETYNPPLTTPPTFSFPQVPPGYAQPTPAINADGTYTMTGLGDGQYTMTLAVPSGYAMTYPYSPNLTFTIAASDCASSSITQINGASCDGDGIDIDGVGPDETGNTGNFVNVNFGLSGQTTWLQSLGGDVRFDKGFDNPIPGVVAVPVPYKSSPGGQGYSLAPGTGSSPGILFTGTTVPNTGSGLISSSSWQLSGGAFGKTFARINPTSLRTSYNYVLTTLKQQGATLQPLTSHAACSDISNCTISNLESGIYQATGTLDIKGFSIPSGRKIVILVEGFIFLSTAIDIPQGSSVAFIADNDIYVRGNVGTPVPPAVYPPPGGDIEGFFSTDKNFVVFGNNNCATGVDRMLNIEGAVIMNASLTGGTLKLYRQLCSQSGYPTLTVKERPDMIL